jgi:hypothetical protein
VLSSLNKVKNDLINHINSSGVESGLASLSNLIVHDVAKDVKELYVEVGLYHAKRNHRELVKVKQLPGLGFSQEWVNNILRVLQEFLINKILFNASETTRLMLYNIVSTGIEKGWGVREIVNNLEEYDGLKYQAERIVRTETNRAANLGTMEAGKSSKFEQQKEWISIRDTRTRGASRKDHANHLALHGQVVDLEMPFTDPRNMDQLMQPGDPQALAESTINCRCTMALIMKRDENGRLIPKKNRINVIMPGSFNRQRQTILI